MTEKNYYENVKQVVYLSNDDGMACNECNGLTDRNLASRINHYISTHGYKLLHVGQETGNSDDGIYHFSIAVLGK